MTAGMQHKDVAAAGVDQSTVSRWISGKKGVPRAGNVVALARKLGRPPVEALVVAGYLNPEDAAAVIEVTTSISELSDDELLAEIARRLAERPLRPLLDDITIRLSPPDDLGERAEN